MHSLQIYITWLNKRVFFFGCGRCTETARLCCCSSEIVLIFELFIGESPLSVLRPNPAHSGVGSVRECVSHCVTCQQTHFFSCLYVQVKRADGDVTGFLYFYICVHGFSSWSSEWNPNRPYRTVKSYFSRGLITTETWWKHREPCRQSWLKTYCIVI